MDPARPPKDRAAEKLEEARRRLFEPPPVVPLWRSPEFLRIGGLLLLLAFVGLFAVLYFTKRAQHAEELARQEAELALQGAPVPPDAELREQRARTLFEGALADTKNGDDFRETAGYTILVRSLASYSAGEVKAKAKRWLDYDGALKDPDGWRGEFVRHRGLVVALQAVKLETPILGIKDVWRGYMREPDGSEQLVFDLVTEPPEIRKRYDAWDIEGVFYRTVRYEDTSGKMREVPYVLAKTIAPREAPPSRWGIVDEPLYLFLALAGLAFVVARLLVSLSKRRRPPPADGRGSIRKIMKERARAPSPPTPPTSS